MKEDGNVAQLWNSIDSIDWRIKAELFGSTVEKEGIQTYHFGQVMSYSRSEFPHVNHDTLALGNDLSQ